MVSLFAREKKLQKKDKNLLFVFQHESTSTTNKTLIKTLRITANETPSSKAKKYKDTHIYIIKWRKEEW